MDFKNKINKNQVRIFELIQSEKKNENKKRWIFEGIHIWPIVCGFLHNSIYSSTIYSKRITKTTRFSSIKRLLLNFSTYIFFIFINRKNYFFFLKKNIDAIFVDPVLFEPSLGTLSSWNRLNKDVTIFDARIAYDLTENSRISFNVDNLFNTEFLLRPAALGRPRTYSILYKIVF